MSDSDQRSGSVSNLEMMGALASRLIHDLANHLSVISGNAQFADMLADNPEKVKKAAASILKSTNIVSNMIGQCGEFRQQLVEPDNAQPIAETIEAIASAAASHDGWTVEKPDATDGSDLRVSLDARWVTFAVSQFIALTGSTSGSLSIAVTEFAKIPTRPGRKLRCAPPKTALEIALRFVANEPVSFEKLKSEFTKLEPLGAYEMIHVASGWVDSESISDAAHAVYIYLPIAETDA